MASELKTHKIFNALAMTNVGVFAAAVSTGTIAAGMDLAGLASPDVLNPITFMAGSIALISAPTVVASAAYLTYRYLNS